MIESLARLEGHWASASSGVQREQVDVLFEAMDADGSGEVDAAEFIAGASPASLRPTGRGRWRFGARRRPGT